MFTPIVILLFLFITCNIAKVDEKESLTNNAIDLEKPYRISKHDPQYMVLAASEVRPGQVYRVVISLLTSFSPLNFIASLQRNGEEIASGKEDRVNPGEDAVIMFQVPLNARPGNYHLQVEGNANGVLGGTGFINKAVVNYNRNFLTILIQTNKLVYNLMQPIKIRVLLLNTHMKPYVDPIDIYLLDSRGYVVKRWVSVYPFQGFASLNFHLPGDYPKGWWTIRVVALQQVEEKRILTERWFTDQFDVNVSLPAFVELDHDKIEGYVTANYTNYLPVAGNATITVKIRPQMNGVFDRLQQHTGTILIKEISSKYFKGSFKFSIEMSEILKQTFPTPILGRDIEFHAKVTDPFYGTVIYGYAITRVINSTIIVKFLDSQPAVFKPGMPFEAHVAVMYSDNVPLPAQRLFAASMDVFPSFTIVNKENPMENKQKLEMDSNGVAKIELLIPKNLERFTLRARFKDGNTEIFANLIAVSSYSQSRRYIHVTTSTEIGIPGEYAIFHVRADFYMESFNYVVIAKGMILINGREKVLGVTRSVTTFAVAISPEMSPNCRVIVYHATIDGEVIADSVNLPVRGLSRQPIELNINRKQDRTGKLVELVPKMGMGAIIGMSAIDTDMDYVQGYNDISEAKATAALYEFESTPQKRVVFKNRHGRHEKMIYYVKQNMGIDGEDTFTFSDLVLFTNLKLSISPLSCTPYTFANSTFLPNTVTPIGPPSITATTLPPFETKDKKESRILRKMYRCLNDNRCYPLSARCDGKRDCVDGSDETNCDISPKEEDQLFNYLLFRRNRNYYFYDSTSSDWAWEDTYTSYQEDNYVGVNVPKRPVIWRLNAVGLTIEHGLSILESSVFFSSVRPFVVITEAPETICLGEQVGIKVALFNHQPLEIRADVILDKSPDYCFVKVGEMGLVSARSPDLICNQRYQHLVYISAYSSKLVHMPIVPRTTGKIVVVITGRTQVDKETKEIPFEVVADGASVRVHTSLLLDMKSQALLLKYININVTDDPIIPYQFHRRFVYGSPQAIFTAIGDVVGVPDFDEDNIVTYSSLSISRPAKSGELFMFNFAYHYFTLLYLRLTNQLDTKSTRKWLQLLNQDYVYQITYFKDGAFTMFQREGSVWLSAYCARVYYSAQYPEWENDLFIDPMVIEKAIRFVLKHQDQTYGFFYEPNKNESYYRYTPIALTSHVIIALSRIGSLPGNIGVDISNAKKFAVTFLEKHLPTLKSPFEVAIVSRALLEAGSVEAKVAFDLLDTLKTTAEGMIYWSSKPIPAQSIKYETQRTFIDPRLPLPQDSEAVEATAYALMVYVRLGGLLQDHIVRWLNYIRLHDEGFTSTYDTIMAVEALVEYSFRTNERSITNIHLTLEASVKPGEFVNVDINPQNLARQTRLPIGPPVYGHVQALAKGAGFGIIQLTTKYNVDRDFLLLKPAVKAFDINVIMSASGRNKSTIALNACAKWLHYKESKQSDIAVMELDIPTGYFQNKAVIDRYVAQGSVPNLKKAKVLPKTAVFMFEYLTRDWTCVNVTLNRWFPVANSTRYMKAKVYELNRPGLYAEAILDNLVLNIINICEVCGSFQCPYCPFFSNALFNLPNCSLIFILITFLIFKNNICIFL